MPAFKEGPSRFASPATSFQRSLAIFLATNTTQGMQYDQPCCWNAHANATMLEVATTTAGDENGCNQAEEDTFIILV
jgi:hypothetical protein